MEMEEGEYEMVEEGESWSEHPSGEVVAASGESAEDGSDPPQLVPIEVAAAGEEDIWEKDDQPEKAKAMKRKRAPEPESESSSSDLTSSEEESIDSDIDTEELEELEAQQGH